MEDEPLRRLTLGWFDAEERLLFPIFLNESGLKASFAAGLANSPLSRSGVFAIADSLPSVAFGPLNGIPWSCSPFAVRLACESGESAADGPGEVFSARGTDVATFGGDDIVSDGIVTEMMLC